MKQVNQKPDITYQQAFSMFQHLLIASKSQNMAYIILMSRGPTNLSTF